MAVFRFVALILIVLGLMLLGADFVTMLETRTEPQLRSVEAVWALFSDTGVAAFKAWVPGVLPAPVPEGILTFLSFPAFAVFGLTGVILAVLFRERESFGEASA